MERDHLKAGNKKEEKAVLDKGERRYGSRKVLSMIDKQLVFSSVVVQRGVGYVQTFPSGLHTWLPI